MVVTGGTVSEMALHFLERYKVRTPIDHCRENSNPTLPPFAFSSPLLPLHLPSPLLPCLISPSLSFVWQLMCVKVPSKWDLRRLTGAVNATALVRLGPPTADEAGSCDLIEVRELSFSASICSTSLQVQERAFPFVPMPCD